MQGAVRLGATTRLLALSLAAACGAAAPVAHVVAEPAVARLVVCDDYYGCNWGGIVGIAIGVILLISGLAILAWILMRRRREAAATATPTHNISTTPAGVAAGIAGAAGAPAPGAYPPMQDGKTVKGDALYPVHPSPYPQTTTTAVTTNPGVNMVYQTPVHVQRPPPSSITPPVGGYGAPYPTHQSGQQKDVDFKDSSRPEQQISRPHLPPSPPAGVPSQMYGSVVLASANDLSQAPSHVSGTPNTPTSLPVHVYGSVIDQSHIPPPNPR